MICTVVLQCTACATAADAVAGLLAPLPVSKLRQLGGKFGEEVVAKLGVSTVGELVSSA
jgi:nucleotidyltransferase/DNA polymerase involved in DNA repair